MKRLILHIGTHKTGSTALQNVFERQRSTLASAGICYPSTSREPYPHLPKHSSLYFAAAHEPSQFHIEFDLMRSEAEAAGCETLLVSEEGFSVPMFEKFKIFGDLRPEIDIEIYVYLRRQDYFIESLWNQYAKEGHETRSIVEFSSDLSIKKRGDYFKILQFWSKIGTVHAAEYNRAKVGGISKHFSAFAGIPDLPEATKENPSTGMNAALIRTWFNAAEKSISIATRKLIRNDERRYALGSELRASLLEEFTEINRSIAETYGITFSTEMPVEDAEPLLSPDSDLIMQILLAVSDEGPNLGDVSADDLRDAAGTLRKKDPEAAFRLVNAALRLRPEGPLLLKMRDEIKGSLPVIRSSGSNETSKAKVNLARRQKPKPPAKPK